MSVWAVIFVTLQLLTGTQAILARGDSFMTQGRIEEAIAQYRELVRTAPASFEGYNKLGFALMRMGHSEEAYATLRRAVEMQPLDAEAHNNLGVVLMQAGRFQDAVPWLQRAVELKPDYSEAHLNLANAFAAVGQPKAAVGQFREAIRARPDWPPALSSLAWLEATDADALRDPGDAVRLASRAADLSGKRDPQVLDVLAAAYAAAGRFTEATRTAEMAEALAAGWAPDPDLAAQIRAHLSLYRTGHQLVVGGR
jgi:tetratricopeptide (TPR) repeat protein